VIITGSRGIGKSSFGYQLQLALSGDNTLLRRVGIETKFPRHLCAFYACDPNITLEQLVLDILFNLEQQVLLLPEGEQESVKKSLELNLGVIKTKIEAQVKRKKRSPSTLASQFVEGINQIVLSLKSLHLFDAVNIMLDELDQLPADINFGHFVKIVHETLVRKDMNFVTFIFAGQLGLYTRFLNEDKSFERIVRHVCLSPLDADASSHVLYYGASQAIPTFSIEDDALGLILSLASGYPYVLHFLGDAAFTEMGSEYRMVLGDVINGLSNVLQSDKREKYLFRLNELSNKEFLVIYAMSTYSPNSIPAEIPISWLRNKVAMYFNDYEEIDSVIVSLVEKGHLNVWDDQEKCLFSEELFRVFVSMIRLERRENEIRKKMKRPIESQIEREKKEKELMRMIIAGELGDITTMEELESEDLEGIYEEIGENLKGLTYTTAWEDEDIFDHYGKDEFFR
jgi:hypothetical protein